MPWYAFHPKAVRGAMVIDQPIAGVDPWDKIKVDPSLWHFGFHAAPGLAEKRVAGREAIYLEYFLRSAIVNPQSVSDDDIARYPRAYARPGRLAAAMNMYRAFPEDEKFGRERRGPLAGPITLVGGGAREKGFGSVLPAFAKGLRAAGARSVNVEVIAGSGHYVIEENPDEMAALIQRYAS